MYSESDIEHAVATGAITPAAAAALRQSVAEVRAAPLVDEESFRLITGFNDIFVTIAALLLLVAVGWIGFSIAGLAPAGFAVGAASWGLAEYFTRKRRMALPSIVLLGAFVYGVAAFLYGLGMLLLPYDQEQHGAAGIAALTALLTAGAAYLHWRRFQVPITIAALTGALVMALWSALLWLAPAIEGHLLWVILAAGISVFAFAMRWDMSDRLRQTRRSDVAFWLHLSAAPMIAHPVFNLLGVMNNAVTPASGLIVITLYVLFGIVALAIDRRALLVSSLIYVLYALAGLFEQAGAVSLNIALTALVIGSALLLLSAFWHSVRRIVVTALPAEAQDRLPALDRPITATSGAPV